MLAPGLPIQGPTSLRAWGCCPRSHLLSRLPRPGSKPPPQALSCAFLLWWSLSLGAQHQGLGHLTPVPTEPLTWRQLPFPTVGQTSGQEGRMWPQVAPARESSWSGPGRGRHARERAGAQGAGPGSLGPSYRPDGGPGLADEEDGRLGKQGRGLPLPRGPGGAEGTHQAVGRVWVGRAAARAALRAKPTALPLLCLREAGWRACPRLGPACLSSPAQRSWGPRSRACLEAVGPI